MTIMIFRFAQGTNSKKMQIYITGSLELNLAEPLMSCNYFNKFPTLSIFSSIKGKCMSKSWFLKRCKSCLIIITLNLVQMLF